MKSMYVVMLVCNLLSFFICFVNFLAPDHCTVNREVELDSHSHSSFPYSGAQLINFDTQFAKNTFFAYRRYSGMLNHRVIGADMEHGGGVDRAAHTSRSFFSWEVGHIKGMQRSTQKTI